MNIIDFVTGFHLARRHGKQIEALAQDRIAQTGRNPTRSEASILIQSLTSEWEKKNTSPSVGRGYEWGAILYMRRLKRQEARRQEAEAIENGIAINQAAGFCLGCGGTLNEQGECMGDGDKNYNASTDPRAAEAIAKFVAEKFDQSAQFVPVDQDARDAERVRLNARLDQIKAELADNPNADVQAELRDIIGRGLGLNDNKENKDGES